MDRATRRKIKFKKLRKRAKLLTSGILYKGKHYKDDYNCAPSISDRRKIDNMEEQYVNI